MAEFFTGILTARREQTRVKHPHEPGTDPRDQYQHFNQR